MESINFYFIVSLIISVFLGKVIIPELKKLKAGQSIRIEGPKSHFVKSGTPTMGGIIFLFTTLIMVFVSGQINIEMLVILLFTFAFGLVGFFDDYIKVIKKRNLGLTAKQKLLVQIGVTLILIFYQYKSSNLGTNIIIPIMNKTINIGFLYIPFIIFVVVGTVNAVNLTDGLDGLSSGVTIICLVFFAFVAKNLGRTSIEIFCVILIGALLGFLYFNKYPARVFMGDTGSLALGGAISVIAILLNMPLILPIAGGIYFIEALSVIIQVISFKLTGKRVFLMSPLHHHYEQKGWKETKVVVFFYILEIIMCVVAYKMIF